MLDLNYLTNLLTIKRGYDALARVCKIMTGSGQIQGNGIMNDLSKIIHVIDAYCNIPGDNEHYAKFIEIIDRHDSPRLIADELIGWVDDGYPLN